MRSLEPELLFPMLADPLDLGSISELSLDFFPGKFTNRRSLECFQLSELLCINISNCFERALVSPCFEEFIDLILQSAHRSLAGPSLLVGVLPQIVVDKAAGEVSLRVVLSAKRKGCRSLSAVCKSDGLTPVKGECVCSSLGRRMFEQCGDGHRKHGGRAAA